MNLQSIIAWRDGTPVDRGTFLSDVDAAAACLGSQAEQINLCRDRYEFLVCFAAALRQRRISLLSPSDAPVQIDALADSRPATPGRMEPAMLGGAPGKPVPLALDPRQTAVMAFTSGTRGKPQTHVRTWGELAAVARLSAPVAVPMPRTNIVSTVPQQHLFGLEFTAVMPLTQDCAISNAEAFYPGDMAQALRAVPEPRLLVSTPLQLRALLDSKQSLPALSGVLCATAPLDVEIARSIERQTGATLTEIYGCTEAGSIAWRRPTCSELWQLHPGYSLEFGPEAATLRAPTLSAAIELQDRLEDRGSSRFALLGRSGDLIKVAGKRASLADLTRRLLAVPGVEDGVIFEPQENADGRLAALVVAPGASAQSIARCLRSQIDPVFLPRPLRLVDRLPRNALGKLPRAALIEALERGHG